MQFTSWIAGCLAVALSSSAWAADPRLHWWVPDEDAAEHVQEALGDLWPGHPVQVTVGVPQGSQEGIFYRSPELILYVGGRVWREPVVAEASTQVVLARSWVRELQLSDGGWAPDLSRPEPSPFEDPEPVEEVHRMRLWGVGSLGTAFRPGEGVAVHSAGQAGLALTPGGSLVGLFSVDALERGVLYGQPVAITRGALLIGGAAHLGTRWGVLATIAGGVRYGDVSEDGRRWPRIWTGTASLRLHGFSPEVFPLVRVGGGLGLDVDGRPLLQAHGAPPGASPRVALTMEMSLLFGQPFGKRENR